MKKITELEVTKIKEAFVWLQHNGYHEEVETFLYEVKMLIQKAMENNYEDLNGVTWDRRIERACKKIAVLDKAYYDANGEHFTRKYNRLDKNDMTQYISTIATAVVW